MGWRQLLNCNVKKSWMVLRNGTGSLHLWYLHSYELKRQGYWFISGSRFVKNRYVIYSSRGWFACRFRAINLYIAFIDKAGKRSNTCRTFSHKAFLVLHISRAFWKALSRHWNRLSRQYLGQLPCIQDNWPAGLGFGHWESIRWRIE